MTTWSKAKEDQYKALSEEPCADNGRLGKGRAYSRHGLVRVTTRSWRDLFRKRAYWRCWFCDLRVEVEK